MTAKIKLPREMRLAYLVHLLHQRILKGQFCLLSWGRHYRLTLELDSERAFKYLTPRNGRMS